MPSPAITQKIAFVGGGQMAEALIAGMLSAKLCGPDRIWATDPAAGRLEHLKKKYGIQVGGTNREAVVWGDVVVLAVKPQVLDAVLKEIGSEAAKSLIVSVVAGAPIRRIVDACGQQARVIRTMPNTPAMVHEGMTALAVGSGVQENDVACVRQIFESVGRVVPVEERLMDAVTGLSGSGPAYVFLVIEALTDGGVKMGLPRDTAGLLAAQTVLGAARMVLETGQHPARLKDQVASPGGTTIAGLHRLEQGGLRATLIDAIEAATKRSQELGR
ncbi:MAG TPA: pyrroline-5-carboxylate reductase [Nitrospiraceae bacterium]|nr:pyrroline-5-carboxylate reductase [Nitrospiraceae bacterium]